MMLLIIHSILIALMVVAFVQDMRHRAITWYVFPLIGAAAICLFFVEGNSLLNVLMNLLFVTVIIGCLFIYIALKEKQIVNIFENHFGIGDVLFLVAVTPLFDQQHFVLFFISGMFLSALIHLTVYRKKNVPTIPLAGYLAAYITLLIGIENISDLNLLYTHWHHE